MQSFISLPVQSNFTEESICSLLEKEIFELDADQREEFEERAAIMEFEAGFSREESEWRALQIVEQRKLKIAV